MVEVEARPPASLIGAVPGPPRAQAAPPAAPEESQLVDIGDVLRDSPPWLISAIVHMVMMIAFGLMIVQAKQKDDLLLDAGYAEDFGDPSLDDLTPTHDAFEVEENVLTADNLPVVEDPLATPAITEVAPSAVMPTGPVTVPTAIGMALTGREPGMKEALLKSSGGTGKTESAVALGLRWLASQQHRNGLWSLKGPYSNGSRSENPESATAMALLAFQGAGYTPTGDTQETFTRVVRRGWEALLARMDENGRFFNDEQPRTHRLYTQAQCTIALCELYAMTGEAQYFDAAQKAVDQCVALQTPGGGWRYDPGEAGDMSVTGWFVMALQSARMAGIEVPSPVFDKIEQFMDSVARDEGSRYAYRPTDGATLTLTAEGLLCRQYLGWARDDPRLNAGVGYLIKNLPEWRKRNVYYWYYATQVMHHMEGKPWQAWNDVMRELLPESQIKRGRERGSWDPLSTGRGDPGDRWGDSGGRLYVTCLSICTLEVYYRHLPLYRKGLFENVR